MLLLQALQTSREIYFLIPFSRLHQLQSVAGIELKIFSLPAPSYSPPISFYSFGSEEDDEGPVYIDDDDDDDDGEEEAEYISSEGEEEWNRPQRAYGKS